MPTMGSPRTLNEVLMMTGQPHFVELLIIR